MSTYITQAKYGLFMLAGVFGIYHGATGAAVAAFIMAGLQPLIASWAKD